MVLVRVVIAETVNSFTDTHHDNQCREQGTQNNEGDYNTHTLCCVVR